MNDRFRTAEISGDAEERGFQHGEQLADEIHQAIDFYDSIFRLPEGRIFELADFFQQKIKAFNPDYCTEMRAIAEAANVDPHWIVALNSRTEILSSHLDIAPTECTSICFSQASLLGQNWDWASALEPLLVLMRVRRPDGHIIRMVTEPGILGKIGMNNCGLGVCLNILAANRALDGIPVHIMLRSLLDCHCYQSASDLLVKESKGKASHILMADAKGNAMGAEFNSEEFYHLVPEDDCIVHANHYLGSDINTIDDPHLQSSFARQDTAETFLMKNEERDVTVMKRLLSDDVHPTLPIYRYYVEDELIQDAGTVCSIVMDLPKQQIHLRKGKHENSGFITYQV